MQSSYVYKQSARQALKGNWSESVLTCLVQSLLNWPGTLVGVFVSNPLNAGVSNAFKNLLKGEKKVFDNTFSIGFNDYIHKVAGILLRNIYTFLWSLLLIVPGIVKSYSYAMTAYLLVDEPDLDAESAIRRSSEMMRGHKWDLFCLDLSFIGWIILCFLTAGIGFLWLFPFIETAHAAFYEELRQEFSSR